MFGKRDSMNKLVEKALNPILRDQPGVSCDIRLQEGARVLIALTCPDQATGEGLLPQVKAAAEGVKGVESAHIVLSAARNTMSPHYFIAVASGKGGVGKSTVTMNLARAMAAAGLSVGILDADVYGPSIPTMAALPDGRVQGVEGKIIPLHNAEGICVMSVAFMTKDKDAPLIWRGPMLHGALNQLLNDVQWANKDGGRLDVVLIDMPPGTGDVALTLSQKAGLHGAVIVTTPQDIALIDARKAAGMFTRLNVPLLGVVENMATHICSECGHEEAIFGTGGGAAEAEHLNTPHLGSIPLSRAIRMAADAGEVPDLSPYHGVLQQLNLDI